MANLFSAFQDFGNFVQDVPKNLGLLSKEKNVSKVVANTAKTISSVKPKTAADTIDDIAGGVAKTLSVPRNTQITLGTLPDVVFEKGKGLLDNISTAEKSFYQGKIPDKTLAKFASPSVGAATGAAAGNVVGSFFPQPIIKGAAIGLGALGGGALGLLGIGNLTNDQKKAAQIRSEESGFQKQFTNPQQLGFNAASNLKGWADMPVDLYSMFKGTTGAINEGMGKALTESNLPILKQYGQSLMESGQTISKFTKEETNFLRDKINYASNLAFKPKNEQEGRKKVKELPLEVIQNMSPESVRAMVLGEGLDKISIPFEVAQAYNNSQNQSAQNRMINEFRKEGKTDEEIQKLIQFGMAGTPLESVAQSLTSDPTMLFDLTHGGISAGKKVGRASKLKNLNNERKLVQLERAKTPIINPETGQLQMKGLKSEISNFPEVTSLDDQGIEDLLNYVDDPNQVKLNFNQLEPQQRLLSSPQQKLLEAPKQTKSSIIDDFNLEQQKLTNEGIDLDSFEGDEALINNLLSKGYDESEILSALEQKINPEDLISSNKLNEIDELYKPLYEPNYINPTEDDIYNSLREGTIPGLDENSDLSYKLTQGGGLPIGFYENDKLVPIYNNPELGLQKRLPVKFEFSSPLEKEIFTKYGGEYVDWMRDNLIGDIKNSSGIKNKEVAQKVLTDKQKEERFKDLGNKLLLGTSDSTYLDSLNLPKEAKKEVDTLMDDFVKKLYSGGSKTKGGKAGEGVIGHVPNSIRKDILKQISTKLNLDNLSASEKKKVLQNLKPEELQNEVFKLSSTAYKGIIDKTKEYRNKFKSIIDKYKS